MQLTQKMLTAFFMSFPDLTTERLILRQLKMEDVHEIFRLRSDEEVNKYLDRPKATSIEDAEAFIQKINAGIHDHGWLYWAMSIKEDHKLIGTICFFNLSVEKGNAEIGYELLPGFQGRGFMQEAVSKVIAYVFESVGLKMLDAVLHIDNENSIKLLKKNNFKRNPEAEQEMDADDRSKGMIVYSLKKQE